MSDTGITTDEPYDGRKPDFDAEIVVECGTVDGDEHTLRVFAFARHSSASSGSGWELLGALDTSNVDDMNIGRSSRSVGGRFVTGNQPGSQPGWRLRCSECRRDEQFGQAGLSPSLDRMVELGQSRISLKELAAGYANTQKAARRR